MMTQRGPVAEQDAREPDHAPQSTPAPSDEGHAGHPTVSRTEIVWVTVLSIAAFALAFVVQSKANAVIEWLPLTAIDRAFDRLEHGDVAQRAVPESAKGWRTRNQTLRTGLIDASLYQVSHPSLMGECTES